MGYPTIHTTRDLKDSLTMSYEQALEALQQGEIAEEIGLVRWGSNYTFIVRIVHKDTQFLGVYKPRSGENSLWDFPSGTLCQRETVSFMLSQLIGWYIVPPTVLREGTRGLGSVQVFIDHDPDCHYFTLDDTYQTQIKRLALFDVIVNNADRKGGHCLVDADDHIWGIDHGLTFNQDPKLRTVIWEYAGQAIPDDLLQSVHGLCETFNEDTEAMQHLEALLNPAEMIALQQRMNTLLIDGVYPMPGTGPNRPWPAI